MNVIHTCRPHTGLASPRRRYTHLLVMCGLPVLITASALDGFELNWSTIDGGGYVYSAGGPYMLGGTIGQFDASAAAAMTGGNYSLTGGFWSGGGLVCDSLAAVDFDRDCDVDLYDLVAFESCATGPAIPYSPGCEGKDLNADGDVDQTDFGAFQRCYSGENNQADPNCIQ